MFNFNFIYLHVTLMVRLKSNFVVSQDNKVLSYLKLCIYY